MGAHLSLMAGGFTGLEMSAQWSSRPIMNMRSSGLLNRLLLLDAAMERPTTAGLPGRGTAACSSLKIWTCEQLSSALSRFHIRQQCSA